jgi:hypothetical protein
MLRVTPSGAPLVFSAVVSVAKSSQLTVPLSGLPATFTSALGVNFTSASFRLDLRVALSLRFSLLVFPYPSPDVRVQLDELCVSAAGTAGLPQVSLGSLVSVLNGSLSLDGSLCVRLPALDAQNQFSVYDGQLERALSNMDVDVTGS